MKHRIGRVMKDALKTPPSMVKKSALVAEKDVEAALTVEAGEEAEDSGGAFRTTMAASDSSLVFYTDT